MCSTTSVCVRIDKEYLEYLRQLAREKSASEQRDITAIDLIRFALEKQYPMPPSDVIGCFLGGH